MSRLHQRVGGDPQDCHAGGRHVHTVDSEFISEHLWLNREPRRAEPSEGSCPQPTSREFATFSMTDCKWSGSLVSCRQRLSAHRALRCPITPAVHCSREAWFRNRI